VGAGVGLVLFLGYALQTSGLPLTTAAKSGFITGLSIVLVPVISAVWDRRLPRAPVLIGIAAATAGLGLLTLTKSLAITLGDVLTLGCAFCFALHIVLVGRYAGTVDAATFATAQLVPVAAFSGIAALAERPASALAAAPPGVWGLIVFMAATATVGAFLVQIWAQRSTSPSHTGLMFTFEPVAAAIAAFVILGEVLAVRQTMGAALILAGIVVAELSQEAPPAPEP
jgi:drug/metabolite transporter (DMT)-like permease